MFCVCVPFDGVWRESNREESSVYGFLLFLACRPSPVACLEALAVCAYMGTTVLEREGGRTSFRCYLLDAGGMTARIESI